MNPLSRRLQTCLAATLLLSASVSFSQPPPPVPQRAQRVQELAQQKLEAAHPVSLTSPFYCVVDEVDSDVFVTNVFLHAIQFELTAFDPEGRRLSLGSYEVGPTRHLQISLSELLAGADSSFEAGSLSLDFQGEVTMLEAWLVMKSGEGAREQFIEWPFTRSGESDSSQITSFWDTRLLPPETRPTYRVANMTDRAIQFQIETGQGSKTLSTQTREIGPRAVETVEPPRKGRQLGSGWIRLRHQEPGDALTAVGWLSLGPPGQTPFLASLPVETRQADGRPVTLHSLNLALEPPAEQASPAKAQVRAPSRDRAVLSLHNSAASAQALELSLLDFATGAELARSEVVIPPGEIESLELARHFHPLAGHQPDWNEVRVRLWGGDDRLRLWAGKVSREGLVSDLTFLRDDQANASGLYPLPRLADHEIVNTLINLGDSPAEIRAQITWESGTYALPPVRIEPGASHQLDIAALAAQKRDDLLGRSLDPEFRSGYLQWVAQGGSRAILDRLEVRPLGGGSRDLFGFQYNSCCTRTAYGDLIPSSVVVPVGSSGGFLACEFINSCSGILGPYNASITSLSYSSPMSWNGITASASGETSQQVSFEGIAFDFDCYEYEQHTITDVGFFDTCQELHNPTGYDGNKSCTNQGNLVQTCGQCCQCCKFTYREQVCNCKSSATCKAQALTALGACKVNCLTTLGCNQTNYCSGT